VKLARELIEVLFGILFLGVAVFILTATLTRTVSGQPEYRADLSLPPSYLICQQDAGGNCWIRAY
jgi:hypothetical protein